MTESVIEALDNKALGMREAETDGAPVGAAISRPLQDAARSHDDAAGETDCHGPQAALAMTGTEAARVVEDADPYDGETGPVRETEAAEGPDPGILKHLRALHAQAEELKRDFPDFDLDAALHDPAFLRLTAPALGVGVREAFYALNRPRLDALAAARAAEESKALNEDRTPKVIIASGGMCEGGRIRHHLKHNLWDEKNTILFAGYQAAGTLGRIIFDGAKAVRIMGETIEVKAEVALLDGISGHADRAGLLQWLSRFEKMPRTVFVNHGDEDSCTGF